MQTRNKGDSVNKKKTTATNAIANFRYTHKRIVPSTQAGTRQSRSRVLQYPRIYSRAAGEILLRVDGFRALSAQFMTKICMFAYPKPQSWLIIATSVKCIVLELKCKSLGQNHFWGVKIFFGDISLPNFTQKLCVLWKTSVKGRKFGQNEFEFI